MSPASASRSVRIDRDAAADRGLEGEVALGLRGGSNSVVAVLREERLVGGDDGRLRESAQDALPGRLDAADDLDEDSMSPLATSPAIGREELVRDVEIALPRQPSHGDAGELERRADSLGELGRVAGEETRHLRAHDTAAQQGDPEGSAGRGGCCRGVRRSPVKGIGAARPSPTGRAGDVPQATRPRP